MLGDSIRDKAIRLYLDNTSAVAPTFCCLSDACISIYCGALNIGIFPTHVARQNNIRVDYLSRSLPYNVSQMEVIATCNQALTDAHVHGVKACQLSGANSWFRHCVVTRVDPATVDWGSISVSGLGERIILHLYALRYQRVRPLS